MDANTTTSSRGGYTQAVLVGGTVMGVLSALPLVNSLNACCCLWVVAGGILASHQLQQSQERPISVGDGALVGFLSGVAGSVVLSVVSIPISIMMAPVERAMLDRMLSMSGNMPPELRSMLESLGEPRTDLGIFGAVVVRVIGFFFFLILASVFATLGGILGSAMFRKASASPSAPESASSSSS